MSEPLEIRVLVEKLDAALARAADADFKADYLQREINKMRRVMQEAGTWDQFCRDYGAAFPVGVPVVEPPPAERS